MLRGIVYKSTGSWYQVHAADGKTYACRIKGKFKIKQQLKTTNPIAVGDEVVFNVETVEEETGIIHEILPRKNYLIRQSPQHRHQHHIVAANLDQSIIIATFKDPKTSVGFIDRFLVSCEAFHIPAIIIFNKEDILNSVEREELLFIAKQYEAIGYPVYIISALSLQGHVVLQSILTDKTSLITGHSGVGKSTLINTLLPNSKIHTQDVSAWSGKGMHTTTFAEMHNIEAFPGKIIDTPGIRELGVVDIKKSELSGYFPEMKIRLQHCKYNNCMHLNEPGCAIKEAVLANHIHEERYISYVKILDTIEDRHYL